MVCKAGSATAAPDALRRATARREGAGPSDRVACFGCVEIGRWGCTPCPERQSIACGCHVRSQSETVVKRHLCETSELTDERGEVLELRRFAKLAPRRRLRALRVRLRRIFPPFHFGAFPLRLNFAHRNRFLRTEVQGFLSATLPQTAKSRSRMRKEAGPGRRCRTVFPACRS